MENRSWCCRDAGPCGPPVGARRRLAAVDRDDDAVQERNSTFFDEVTAPLRFIVVAMMLLTLAK
jgi:hypothetical protein